MADQLRALAALPERLDLILNPQHGNSHLSVTPAPRDLMPSSDLHGYQACTWYTCIHADQTVIYLKIIKSKNRIVFLNYADYVTYLR